MRMYDAGLTKSILARLQKSTSSDRREPLPRAQIAAQTAKAHFRGSKYVFAFFGSLRSARDTPQVPLYRLRIAFTLAGRFGRRVFVSWFRGLSRALALVSPSYSVCLHSSRPLRARVDAFFCTSFFAASAGRHARIAANSLSLTSRSKMARLAVAIIASIATAGAFASPAVRRIDFET